MILLIFVLLSCKRDELYYEAGGELTLELYVDWSSSDIDPNGVSVLVYYADGELFRSYAPFTATDTLTFTLPEGEYDIVLFNDSDQEHEYLEFTNIDHISTLTATSVDAAVSKATSEAVVENPDFLATAKLSSLALSSSNSSYYTSKENITSSSEVYSQNVVMTRRVYNYYVSVHVEGLQYASGYPTIVFEHLSGGYLIGQESSDNSLVKHSIIFETLVYDDNSTSSGTVTAEFSNFGLLDDSDATYLMDLTFTLIDGSEYTEVFDVTEQIAEENLSRAASFVDKTISVETTLPESIGGDSSDSGAFNTDVEQWEEKFFELHL